MLLLLHAELETHLGISEKSMAEFVFAIAQQCKSVREFQKKLAENGAEFQDSLVHTLWNIIQRLQVG